MNNKIYKVGTNKESVIEKLNSVKDKTLSKGCEIDVGYKRNVMFLTTTDDGGSGILDSIDGEYGYYICDTEDDNAIKFIEVGEIENSEQLLGKIYKGDFFKIVGYPFHFGYAINYLEKEYDLFGTEMLENMLNLWKDKTKDIEAEENKEAL